MSDVLNYLEQRVRGHRCRFCAQETLEPPSHFNQAWRVWLHRDYNGAVEAAESGCSFFLWLVSQVNTSGDPRRDQTFELIFRAPSNNALDVNIVEVRIWTGHYVWPAKIFDVVVDFDDPAASISHSRMIDGDVNSASSREQIKKWLRGCNRATHPMCFMEQDSATTLPPRILDLGNGGKCNAIKLRDVDDKMGFIEYAALSYCWGADTQLQTTLANIAAHKLGIAILDLPQTIKDAIEIAKFVNLRYLWIDSLCIIQDSPDDWTSNCANMQQYYSNSTLTIVAGSATRCNQGFLRPKSTWHSNGFYLPIRMPKGGLGAVKLKERIRTGEPIDTRAWTLQEQLLPKRTLHFATHTVHWKCGRTQHGLRAGIDMIIKSNKSGFEHRSLWQNLVTEYMLREMSNSDDCLPAISGLASWLARDHKITCGSKRCHQKHLEYAAGLWIRENILIDDFRPEIFDIVTQLLWYSQGRSGCRPLRYRAPSWSWAAFEGPISFPLLEVDEVSDRLEVSRTRACVTACETHFASADAPYGRVTGGYISLKCRMKRWPTASEHRSRTARYRTLHGRGLLPTTSFNQELLTLTSDSGIESETSQWGLSHEQFPDQIRSVLDEPIPASWEEWNELSGDEEMTSSFLRKCPNPIVLDAFAIRYIADTEADAQTIGAAYFGRADVWCLEILSGAHKTGGPRGLILTHDEERGIMCRIGVYGLLAGDDEGHTEAAVFFDDTEMEKITIH